MCSEENELDFKLGKQMHELCAKLYPIPRSITGSGFRKSLNIINEVVGGFLNIHAIKSGERVFDWIVPDEWECDDAYIIDPAGNKICDFKKQNLHLVGYSIPIHKTMSLDELLPHIYTLPNMPDAIPYITSYYSRRWGFCMSHTQKQSLIAGNYEIFIKSRHFCGELNYADCILPATKKSKGEILISSYLCHPQMANNELSGPVVLAYLFKFIKSLKERKYDYRFVIVPETIGSICYINKHLKELKANVKAGFVLTCIGDDGAYSYLSSPSGDTLADRVARHVLKFKDINYKSYDFTRRGSDERQYCSALVDLPVCSVMRSKYGEYDEYHTSLDDLNFVTPSGLFGGFDVMKKIICTLEANQTYEALVFCEPNLGSRGLYPTLSSSTNSKDLYLYRDFFAFVNGKRDLLEIADILNVPAYLLSDIANTLKDKNLIKANDDSSV